MSNRGANILAWVFSHDPISSLIYLYCLCLTIIIFYFVLWQILRMVLIFVLSFLRGSIILHIFIGALEFILALATTISLFVVGLLTGIFICLWVAWKILNMLGIAFLALIFFPPFRTAKRLGLFSLLDDLSGIIGDTNITSMLSNIARSLLNFLRSFINILLGVAFEGNDTSGDKYDINNIIPPEKDDKQKTITDKNEKKEETNIDLPKVKFVSKVEPPIKYSKQDLYKINECIKNNTIEIPAGTDTADTLIYNAYNRSGITNCKKNFNDPLASKNPMNSQFENSSDTSENSSNNFMSNIMKVDVDV